MSYCPRIILDWVYDLSASARLGLHLHDCTLSLDQIRIGFDDLSALGTVRFYNFLATVW